MKIKQQELIEDLLKRTKQVLLDAEQFNQYSLEQLNYRANENSWSVLECIEHLNRYGDYYLSEIENSLDRKKCDPNEVFKSGLLGNYFAKSMLPKEKLNKMKTFKDKNPLGSTLDKSTLDAFIRQQNKMLELLNSSKELCLNKIKVTISIGKFIKLRLGDTFRFVIYHNQRHMVQALNVSKEYTNKK